MANIVPLVGNILGVEQQPLEVTASGTRHGAKAGEVLDQEAEAVIGADGQQPMYLENVPHPSNSRLAMAKATRSHLHAFGLDWDDDSGNNNGHFAPFDWSGGA